MRVSGGANPGSYSLELLPNVPGFALARFFENVDETEDGFEYDEYRLRLLHYPGLEQDIDANLALFMEQAKAEEEQAKSVDAKLAEAKEATDEQFDDVEFALCELDGATSERMDDIETALCDLDAKINKGGN